MHFQTTTLDNGIRVLSEEMPHLRSVAIGCWIDTGSRDERPAEAGASHFLEHLLFKGSDRYTAADIAARFDEVGAESNAFTTKEITAFWARLRDADLPLGLHLLGEMTQRPAFRLADIDAERHVVLEEINMNEDDPADTAYEQFSTAMWSGHPIAEPILGTRESILGMDQATIADYWRRRYAPETMVVAAAGHVSHDDLVGLVATEFGSWTGTSDEHDRREPQERRAVSVRTRDTEQAHLVIGGLGLATDDKRRFAFILLDHVFGGGMSSRLFREIREERGLAYAVQSFRMPFRDSGAWGVYVGTTPHQTQQVLDLIAAEIAKIAEDGIEAGELDRAKGFAQGSLALSTEDAASRMMRLGRAEISGVEHLDLDEAVARFDAVTLEQVLDVARETLAGPRAIGAVGPFGPEALEGHLG